MVTYGVQIGKSIEETQRKLTIGITREHLVITQLIAFKQKLTELEKRFEHTYENCEKQAEELENFCNDLTLLVGCVIDNSDMEKAKQSLLFLRFLQSIFDLNELPCLLMATQYTSGIQLLRYHLESMIQAFYLDQRHTTFTLQNKVAILTEISDKREYFVARLIKKLSIGNKDRLKRLYKELSMALHPSHLDFPTIEQMMKRLKDPKASIDCNKLDRVIDLTKRTYDAIFFLILRRFPGTKDAFRTEADVRKVIEKYDLTLLRRI